MGISVFRVQDEIFISFPSGAVGTFKISTSTQNHHIRVFHIELIVFKCIAQFPMSLVSSHHIFFISASEMLSSSSCDIQVFVLISVDSMELLIFDLMRVDGGWLKEEEN